MTMATGLDAVKAATWTLHTKAERGGIVADILAGRARREGVALFLRNLLPVYQILDTSVFSWPGLARSASILTDLQILSPEAEPALLPEGEAYAERVRQVVGQGGGELIAHAYVRYLGDLNGGAILQRSLITCLGEAARALTFHHHPLLEDKAAFTRAYREQLDQAVQKAGVGPVVRETTVAFELNIALSMAVSGRSVGGSVG